MLTDLWAEIAPLLDPATLLQGEFAQGAIVAGVLGFLAYQARAIPGRVLTLLKRRFVVTMEVRDPRLFEAMTDHLASLDYAKRSCRRLSASLPGSTLDGPSVGSPSAHYEQEPKRPKVRFSPSPGRHLVWEGARPILIERTRSDPQKDKGGGFLREEWYVLTTIGSSPAQMKRLVQAVYDASQDDEEARKGVRVLEACGDYWATVETDAYRPMESVILPEDLATEIINDATDFWEKRERYRHLGVPHRRGYLFYGPPGTGKSSAALALACQLKVPLYDLSLASPFSDNSLKSMLRDLPQRCVLLIEDVDKAFAERDKTDDIHKGLTFSGLLNAIDGVTAREGRILILTTNHPDRLDPALVRAGRTDRKFEFGYATADQARRLFARFFPDDDLDSAVFDSLHEVSMADVETALQRHMDDVDGAYQALSLLATPVRKAA